LHGPTPPTDNHHVTKLILTGLVALLVSGCLYRRASGTWIDSRPQGARILLDGRDSGYVTPRQVDLGDEDVRLRLELAGYRPAEVRVVDNVSGELVPWLWLGYGGYAGPRFPLRLPYKDFFCPVRVLRRSDPARIHLDLQPAARE
jgi:hypothetical protein